MTKKQIWKELNGSERKRMHDIIDKMDNLFYRNKITATEGVAICIAQIFYISSDYISFEKLCTIIDAAKESYKHLWDKKEGDEDEKR